MEDIFLNICLNTIVTSIFIPVFYKEDKLHETKHREYASHQLCNVLMLTQLGISHPCY